LCGRQGGHLWYSQTFTFFPRNFVWDWTVCCKEGGTVPTTGGWHFTQHALDRALDMALESTEIRDILREPHVRQPSGANYPDGYEVWARDRIAVVVVPDENTVVTFLWRGVVYERGTESEPFRDN
jgi:hypothetical protein